MNERYVVSLSMAKRLKEWGFPQNNEFVRMTDKLNANLNAVLKRREIIITENPDIEYFPAPLISELLEKLTNMEILEYCNRQEKMPQGEFIDLFRSADKLAEVWLEKHGE